MTAVTETRTWSLTIPAPAKMLSANSRAHWRALRPIAKAWRDATFQYAQQAKLPTGLNRVRIEIVLHHTVNRNRDDANWHPYVGKPIVDAFGPARVVKAKTGERVEVGYGLIPDDTPAHLDGPFISLGEKVPRSDFPLGLAEVTIVDLSGQPTGRFETERRVMSASTVWTFRCPARHQVSVTLGHDDTEGHVAYQGLFVAQHASCEVGS